MHKRFFTANFGNEMRGNGAQGIHTDQATDPGGTDVRYICSLAMRGDIDELLPGIPPFHTGELDLHPGLFLEACQQFKLQIVIGICIRDYSEFDRYHVHLIEMLLRTERSEERRVGKECRSR